MTKNIEYIPTIGLEIHAELQTHSKMFCSCKNDPDEKKPNVNVCPICMGHPGTLPYPNKEAIKSIIKVGYSINGEVADFTEWDRKHYFYPDIPKGYQISQYKYPLVSNGEIDGVKITRIHLEEDTAKSTHDEVEGRSLVNFNRSGVPLMELVTEPVIHDAKIAVLFAKDLRRLLRSLNIARANMEKGEMRVEANISVAKIGSEKFGTKTEVKNLNSFRSVEKAIEYEIKRQIEVIESGGSVIQETRGWDDNNSVTYSQRVKESSHDYRYFPEPDIPKFKISEIKEFSRENMIKEMPELPWEIRKSMVEKYGIKDAEADVFIDSKPIYHYFTDLLLEIKDEKKLAKTTINYLLSDYIGLLKKNFGDDGYEENIGKISPKKFICLMKMIENGEIGSRGAKDTLSIMFNTNQDPKTIAEKEGFIQKNDPEVLKRVVEKAISDNPKVVGDYRNGHHSSIMSLIGYAMKETKGSANPKKLEEMFKEILEK